MEDKSMMVIEDGDEMENIFGVEGKIKKFSRREIRSASGDT